MAAVSQTITETARMEWPAIDESLVALPSVLPDLPEQEGGPFDADLPPYCIFVANDLPHKEWDVVIEAFERNEDLPPIVIVGATARQLVTVSTEDLCRELKTRRRVFLGPIWDRTILASLYRRATAVLVHSRSEAFGLTLSEALATNDRVVAADLEAHREVASGFHLRFYAPAEPSSLVMALRMSIQEPGTRRRGGSVRTRTELGHELWAVLCKAAGVEPT